MRTFAANPTTILIMGVSGSGKSTTGRNLGLALGWEYRDADTFHPPANIAKMSAGHPLDDNDRRPWLDSIGEWLASHGDGGVMSCSALKRSYRDQLREHCAAIDFLHLEGSLETIGRRQASRPGHFMPAALLASQFETLESLEPDEHGIAIDVDQSIDSIIESYVTTTKAHSTEEDR